MIPMNPLAEVFLHRQPVDFRKGIDGLVAIMRHQFAAEPLDGGIFLFTNRKKSSVRLLFYDGQGFWLCTKRLSTGKYRFWPGDKSPTSIPIDGTQLQVLIFNGDPWGIRTAESWRRIA